MENVRIRKFEPRDADALSLIFFSSVREAGLKDYSREQVKVWAPRPPEGSMYLHRANDGRLILLAIDSSGAPIAYADLEANGHIDHLYCAPAYVGRGVASMLYDRLEQEARVRQIPRLFVEASEAARRLFIRKGFQTLERRELLIEGVSIHNFSMEKMLHSNSCE